MNVILTIDDVDIIRYDSSPSYKFPYMPPPLSSFSTSSTSTLYLLLHLLSSMTFSVTNFCPLGRHGRICCWLGGMNLDFLPGQEAHSRILSIWFVSLPGFDLVAERDGGGDRIMCALGRLTCKLFVLNINVCCVTFI